MVADALLLNSIFLLLSPSSIMVSAEEDPVGGWTPYVLDVDKIDGDMCTVDKQLAVKFDGKAIDCGNAYNVGRFRNSPSVTLNRANVNHFYTLLMIDPDAPSRNNPSQRNWLHWLIVNIEDADVKTGFEVAEYNPPTPPSGSGKHRYVFLLLRQTEKQSEYIPVDGRGKFDLNKYAKDYKLSSLYGFTYFLTENK